MSIRLRLTLFYSTILALTLVAFSTTLYVTQTQSTYRSIEANLVRQAGFFTNSSDHAPKPPADGDAGAFTPDRAPAPGADLPSGALPGRWTQTRSITGTITGLTFDLSGVSLPLSDEGLANVQAGVGWFETAQVQDEPLLIYSTLVITREGAPLIVQVAYPVGQPQQTLNTLRLILIAGSSLAILLAFAAGWMLAGAALRPIQRLTHTAQAIGAERNFQRRVEYHGPGDEVSQLALTFNDMLGELESGYRQLEEALQSQRRFVADASHELRTPLTTVRGNIELLRRDPPMDEGERSEVLTDTTGEVDRLIRLVNQLLVLARADSGQALAGEVVPLTPLLAEVCRRARIMAPRHTVVCEPPPALEVQGDRDALTQVLLILVDNAQAHTPPGTVITATAEQAGDQAAISIHDTGPGIETGALPHIFERFYRGDVSRTGGGAGLGLAIARELIQAQGGAISVRSEPGRGSTFTISLPLANAARL